MYAIFGKSLRTIRLLHGVKNSCLFILWSWFVNLWSHFLSSVISLKSGRSLRSNWHGFWKGLRKSGMAKIVIMSFYAGKEVREVYKTLQWDTEGDNQKFNKVNKAFRKYCSSSKHILYERYMFWKLQQEVCRWVCWRIFELNQT